MNLSTHTLRGSTKLDLGGSVSRVPSIPMTVFIFVFTSCGHHNKVPPTGGPETTEIMLTAVMARSPRSRVSGTTPPGRLWGRILLWLSQPLAVPCILGLCHQNFSLCLCPHTVISPVCLCPSLLFLEGHPLYWIGTHPKSV